MRNTSRSYRKNNRKRLGFEALEQRKLLAADFASGIVAAVDVGIAEQVEVQAAEVTSLEVEEVDQALQDLLGETLDSDAEITPEQDLASQTDFDADAEQVELAPVATDSENLDPRNLDLTDSMDGFFGTISPESPTETLNFTAAADGLANVVISNSFEGSDLLLTATSAEGSELEFELLSNDAFDSISFEVNQGETYQLTVSSAQSDGGGQFQLTVGFEEFVDQHADEAGFESTELVWADNQTELTGKLESPGDVDTFRATAPQSGEVTLELDELEEDRRLNLDVTVTDSNGAVLAEGSTNEFLRITFDATESEEFFVTVSGGQGERGDYRFSLNLGPSIPAPQDDSATEAVVTEDSPIEESDSVGETLAEASSDEPAPEDNVVSNPDDVVADLVDAVTGDAGDDELESGVSGEVAANEVDVDAVIIDEGPTGELVDDEVTEIVDQIEEVIDEVSDDISAVIDTIGEEVSEIEGVAEAEEVLEEVADEVSGIIDDIEEEISQVEGISEIEEAIDEVSDEISEIVDVIGEEVSQVEGVSEIEELLGEVSDDVTEIIDVIGEEISEAENISEVEDALAEVSDDVSVIVDTIAEEISEVEGVSEIEDVLNEVSDDVAVIVDEIAEEVSEIDGISDVVDDVSDILEDALADAPVSEVEEAVDQVVGEIEELFDNESEVDDVVGETPDQVAADSTSGEVVVDNDVSVDEANATENVENVEDSIVQAEETSEVTTGESSGDILVAPVEDVAQTDSTLDAEGVEESVDSVDANSDSQLVDENVAEETKEEDDRKFVWSFGSDSVDSFFESLSQAQDDLHDQRRHGFGGWGRRLWRALLGG